MHKDWSLLDKEQRQAYRNLCPDFEYPVFKLDFDLPGISKGLTDQSPMVLMAASGDANGRVYFMANLHRPDPKDKKDHAIDQMPFGFVFDNESPLLSGALIQHGTWDDRTTYPAASAWHGLVDGVYNNYVELGVIPSLSAGSIYDLEGSSQHGAFGTLIDGLSAKAAEVVRQQQNDSVSFESHPVITFQGDAPSTAINATECGTVTHIYPSIPRKYTLK